MNRFVFIFAAALLGGMTEQAIAQSLGLSGDLPASPSTQPLDDAPELMLFKDMPVVVAAGKREQTQRQTAASVSIVKAEEIETFGYRSLADLLRAQRGFYTYTDGLNWLAGVRGFLRPGEWNARITVLVDGRPTRDVIFGQSHLDQDFVMPMEAMKRVEIIRGPGSALYGSNAVFGVINVVTKDGADLNGAQLTLQGGTFDTARASALFGKRFDDGWDILAGVTGFTSQGEHRIHYDDVNDPALNFGNIIGYDAEQAYSAFIKAHKGDFTIQLDAAHRTRDNRSATYMSSFFDPGDMDEDRANLTLRYDHQIADGQSIHAMLHYGYYGYKEAWMYDDDGFGHPYRYESKAHDDWIDGEVHYDWQISKPLHLLLGADGTVSIETRQKDVASNTGTVVDVDPSFNSWALFGEAEWKATDWLTLVGGLRMDVVERIGANFSPRAAAIVTPTANDTFKAMYGRAFREPNLYEMFYNSPGYNAPNPGLEAEVCDTYEVLWERQFAGGWRTTVNGFIWHMSSAMEDAVLPDGAVQTQNGRDLWCQGIELELAKQWENGASLRVHGSVVRATRRGDRLNYSPQWMAGASAAYPIFKRTFLAVEPQIVGGMKSDFGKYTDPTFITNVVLTSREITKGLDAQIGVYNIFAKSARLPRNDGVHSQPFLNWPGTTLMASVTYRF